MTISTNMAGRGDDIRLGHGVAELGGLYVIGTNRHESRRIDNQLRGRAGRQGDPGWSRFFVSLEDALLVKYGIDNQRIRKIPRASSGRSKECNSISGDSSSITKLRQRAGGSPFNSGGRTFWKG